MENQEEVTQSQDGSNNRTFVMLVAVLGGLLVLGIGAFVAWAFVIAPRMRADIETRNESIFATNTAVAVAAAATETHAATATATNTPVPTSTLTPSATPSSPPATATEEPTPTLSFETPRTENESEPEEIPKTGLGVLGGAVLVGGLTVLLVLIRRLREVD